MNEDRYDIPAQDDEGMVFLEDGTVMAYDEYLAMIDQIEQEPALFSLSQEPSLVDRPFLDTPFSEYSVTEGLLLRLVLSTYFALLWRFLRRCF